MKHLFTIVCLMWQISEINHCESNGGTGAAVGWFFLGPLGAVAGAIAGSGHTECKPVQTKKCLCEKQEDCPK